MAGRTVLAVSAALLAVAALVTVAYRLGSGPDGDAPETLRDVVDRRLASLEGIERRLERLEAELASLRRAAAEASAEAEEPTVDVEARWAAVESALSKLLLRVDGLEQDPLRRGYSYLASQDAEMRREGVNILTRAARFDPEARAAIRAVLHDPSARVREQAAQKLRDLEDTESAADMVALLEDPDPRTRRRAVQALGAIGADDAVAAIGRNLIEDADDAVRRTAADVLGRLKSPAAAEFLVQALTDRNEAIRGEAIASLGEIGATSAVPRLRALYDKDPGSHRMRLVLALRSLGDEVPLQREFSRLSEVARLAADASERRQAIRDLAVLDRSAGQQIFSEALDDPSPLVRREAERALR